MSAANENPLYVGHGFEPRPEYYAMCVQRNYARNDSDVRDALELELTRALDLIHESELYGDVFLWDEWGYELPSTWERD